MGPGVGGGGRIRSGAGDAAQKIPLLMTKSIEFHGIMHNTPSLFYQSCQILTLFSQKNSSETIMKDHTEIKNTEKGNVLIFSWLHFF